MEDKPASPGPAVGGGSQGAPHLQHPWSLDAWLEAIKQVRSTGDPPAIRKLLEEAVIQFPTVAKLWIAYIDYESGFKNWEGVEALFARCVQQAHGTSVELWRAYLAYVKMSHAGRGGSATTTSGPGLSTGAEEGEGPPSADADVVIQAYEVALQAVGLDREAGSIWADYLAYVAALPSPSMFEEQQRMDRLRKIYHQCITIPLLNLEALWRDYDGWENRLNRLTAKKLLGDHSPAYMTARSALGALKHVLEGVDQLLRDHVPRPPTWSGEREVALVLAHKKWIMWERSNPLHLKEKQALQSRVLYAYKKSLASLRFYPEMYQDYAHYLQEVGMAEEAVEVLRAGLQVMPASLLLTFTLAEVHEAKAAEFGPTIAPLFDALLTRLTTTLHELQAQYATEREALLAELQAKDAANAPDAVPESEWDGERREAEREKQKARERMVAEVLDLKMAKQESRVKRSLSLTWITYMRCALRSANIKTARGIFGRARKSDYCSYHVFVASALLEYHCNRDATVAGKIFEVGLKTVDLPTDPDAPAYVLEYLRFLISLNDENNARSLFERALSSIPAVRARSIWSLYLDYEAKYGESGSVDKVIKRMAMAYPEDVGTITAMRTLGAKYAFLDLTVVGELELGITSSPTGMELPLAGAPSYPRPASSTFPAVGGVAGLRPGVPASAPSSTTTILRHKNMEAVNPDAYPRPDLARWAQYRPDPVAVEAAKANLATAVHEDGAGVQARSSAPSSPTLGSGRPHGMGLSSGPPPPDHVPEAIVQFLRTLGPPHLYTGPVIGALEFMEIMRIANVPLPSVPPRYVPYSLQALWGGGQGPPPPGFVGVGGPPGGGGYPLPPRPPMMPMGPPGALKRERMDDGPGRNWPPPPQQSYRALPEKRYRP